MKLISVEFLGISIFFIIPIISVYSGAGECRRFLGARTLDCYDCDSRYDDYCFTVDKSNLTAPKPKVKPCQGCCVKFYHQYPDSKPYIQRSCTEHIIINYFMVDHVCMNEGRGRGKMCFCEDRLCNKGENIQSAVSFLAIICLTVVALVSKSIFVLI